MHSAAWLLQQLAGVGEILCPCPVWNPLRKGRAVAEKWALWTNSDPPSGLFGVKQGPFTFLSLPQGMLCSKTLSKMFAWQMTESNHHIYFKRTDGKASLAVFWLTGPLGYPNKSFWGWASHMSSCLQEASQVQTCPLAVPWGSSGGPLWAAGPGAGPARPEPRLGEGSGWSRAQRGDWTTQGTRAPRDPRPPTGQTSTRNDFWCVRWPSISLSNACYLNKEFSKTKNKPQHLKKKKNL